MSNQFLINNLVASTSTLNNLQKFPQLKQLKLELIAQKQTLENLFSDALHAV